MMRKLSLAFIVWGLILSPVLAGDKIAFISSRDGNRELYLMDRDGGNPLRLTRDNFPKSNPVWSPDGRRIAFVADITPRGETKKSKCALYAVESSGRNLKRLATASLIASPQWTPDGRRVAFIARQDIYGSEVGVENWVPQVYEKFVRSDSGIAIVDSIKENQMVSLRVPDTLVNALKSRSWLSQIRISPDGARIAFTAAVNGEFEDIYVTNLDGNRTQKLTRTVEEYVNVEPRWVIRTSQLYFRKIWNPGADIYAVDFEGKNSQAIVKGDIEEFAISPDVRKLTFIASEKMPGEVARTSIMVSDIGGKWVKNLTDFTALDARPTWSSDGKQIAFSRGTGDNSEIYIMADNKTFIRRLTRNFSFDGEPSWQP